MKLNSECHAPKCLWGTSSAAEHIGKCGNGGCAHFHLEILDLLVIHRPIRGAEIDRSLNDLVDPPPDPIDW